MHQMSRYRYLSFEETVGASVESTESVELDGLILGATIPTRYVFERDDYTIRVRVDSRSHDPNATISLVDSPMFRLVPRPGRGVRAGRPRPCGSYDEIASSGKSFVFSWVICGEDALDTELSVAFDVVDEHGSIAEENLQFELRSDGFLLLRDNL
jgi:hypothetical protein